MATTLLMMCANCGNPFDMYIGELGRHLAKGREDFFCDRTCGVAFANRRPAKRESNRKAGLKTVGAMYTPKRQSLAALNRESWKYVKLKRFLVANGITHKFEYPLVTAKGSIRLYDLALKDSRTLVEFDGDYHQRNGDAYNRRDRAKERLAEKHGWIIVRVVVKANTVILPSSIASLVA